MYGGYAGQRRTNESRAESGCDQEAVIAHASDQTRDSYFEFLAISNTSKTLDSFLTDIKLQEMVAIFSVMYAP